jgi:hypothetical protein
MNLLKNQYLIKLIIIKIKNKIIYSQRIIRITIYCKIFQAKV